MVSRSFRTKDGHVKAQSVAGRWVGEGLLPSCPSHPVYFPTWPFISIFCSIIYDQWEEQVKFYSGFLELAALADYRIRAEVMGTPNTQPVWSEFWRSRLRDLRLETDLR